MKVRRSDRLIDMTRYLLDLAIVRRTFAQRQTGILETVPGAAGGVRYIPIMGEDEAENFIAAMAKRLSETDRLLPGGYVYLSDLLGTPSVLRQIGRLIATQYREANVDAVMTVATKGIPIAQSVSQYLNVPFVIVRRDSKITEGSTVSVNYVSGSSARIEKMELSKRSLPANSRVLIVDDFMKGGGTVNGMKALIDEFNAKMVGITVFAEGKFDGDRMVNDYTSLIRVDKVDTKANTLHATAGNFLSQNRQLLEVSHQ